MIHFYALTNPKCPYKEKSLFLLKMVLFVIIDAKLYGHELQSLNTVSGEI